MKLAFLADIHGNAIALEAALKDMNAREVEKIFVLGDLCFRGPEPKKTLDIVQSLNADVIKGNADEWVVRGIKKGEVPQSAFEMMNKEREWIVSRLDQGSVKYLNELPTELNLEVENIKIHAFHATPNSLFDVVLPSEPDHTLTEKLMSDEADIYVYGHIHKPFIRYIDGKCLINTGSVGLPFDGLARSSYAIVEMQKDHFQTSIVRVGYDFNKVVSQYKEFGYPNAGQLTKVIENARI